MVVRFADGTWNVPATLEFGLLVGTRCLVHYLLAYGQIIREVYSTRSNPQTLVKSLCGRNFSRSVGWEGWGDKVGRNKSSVGSWQLAVGRKEGGGNRGG
jgi:hypothetical protein